MRPDVFVFVYGIFARAPGGVATARAAEAPRFSFFYTAACLPKNDPLKVGIEGVALNPNRKQFGW